MPHERWLGKLTKLNKARDNAPHKPLLLLVFLEVVENGDFAGGSLPLTAELAYRFDTFFNVVQYRRTAKPDVRMPFHHLKTDGFWSAHMASGELSEHRSTTAYVVPDPEFVEACRDPEFRQQARTILIATHFEPAERNAPFGSVDRRTGSVITDGIGRSGTFPSSVAPKVATDTPENGCKPLITVAETDAELVRVVAAWPKLSAVVKRMILGALDSDRADAVAANRAVSFGRD